MKASRSRVVVSKPSRRGCRTCRIRKIKCDEARPCCNKCTSTGRNCDGYELSPEPSTTNANRQLLPNPNRSTTSPLAFRPRTSTPPINTTTRERHAFDYFVSVGAQEIWNVSPSKEWIPLALQLASTEPAVFQAITALSTAQRGLTLTLHKVLEPPRARRNMDFALQQFTKSAASLQRYIDQGNDSHAISMEPVILCAVLFLCFELFRGKYQNAIAHMHFGRRILMGMHANESTCQGDLAITRESPSPRLSKNLLDAFNHAFHVLGNNVIFPGPSRGLDQDALAGIPHVLLAAFVSLEQAQEHFTMLSSARSELRAQLIGIAEERISSDDKRNLEPGVLLALTHCLTRAVAATAASAIQTRIQELITAHYAWLSALNNLEKTTSSSNAQNFLLITILKVKHFLALHTLHTCATVRETVHDAFMPAFKEMVDLIDRFFVIEAANMIPGVTGPALPLHPDHEKQGSFSLEPAILPTMALIAFKCRDSILRYRTLAQLGSARRREGGLFSSGMACFIKRMVELEETRAREIMGIPTQVPLQVEQVPEAARFLDIAMRGDTSKCTMIAAARFRHDEGDKALEVREWRWALGYPVVLEEVGTRVFDYTC